MLGAGAVGVVAALAAAETTVQLVDPATGQSSGWEVVIFNDGLVDVVTDAVRFADDRVVIQKFAEFIDIDPFTGAPAAVLLDFRQVAADADTVSQIVITDERVINNTGLDWIDFEFFLVNDGEAVFNRAASADFDISPFTRRDYSDDNTFLRLSGGTVADGATWTPGLTRGGLVIDVDLSADTPVNFTLKELPSIPAPGGAALAALGGLAAGRRRR